MARPPVASDEPPDPDADLGELERQTLSGVQAFELPPEPFAIGLDLGKLTASRAPSVPPARLDDTDGRLDLKALKEASQPPPAATPAANPLAPVGASAAPSPARSPFDAPSSVAASTSSPFATAPQSASSDLDRELDDLIAARGIGVGGSLRNALSRVPTWSWVLVLGIGLGIGIGSTMGGKDSAVPASAAVAAATPVATPSPTPTPTVAAPTSPPPSAAPTPSASAPSWKPIGAQAAAAKPAARAAQTASRAKRGTGARASGERDEARAAPAGDSETRSIDALLDQALPPGKAAPATRAAPAPRSTGPALSKLPARDEVARVLSELLPRIRFCAGGRSGVATAKIAATPNGRIASAQIMGVPFSHTPAGDCMARVIKTGARFSPFSDPLFRVTYPYSL